MNTVETPNKFNFVYNSVHLAKQWKETIISTSCFPPLRIDIDVKTPLIWIAINNILSPHRRKSHAKKIISEVEGKILFVYNYNVNL